MPVANLHPASSQQPATSAERFLHSSNQSRKKTPSTKSANLQATSSWHQVLAGT